MEQDNLMEPPYVKYGDYFNKFLSYYKSLSVKEKVDYRKKYPPVGEFKDFYKFMFRMDEHTIAVEEFKNKTKKSFNIFEGNIIYEGGEFSVNDIFSCRYERYIAEMPKLQHLICITQKSNGKEIRFLFKDESILKFHANKLISIGVKINEYKK